MADYAASNLSHEKTIIVITSTFGTGEPPTNGVQFNSQLLQMVKSQTRIVNGHGPPR
jgi:sulfite reductase alpha subunit-like flavoprotein